MSLGRERYGSRFGEWDGDLSSVPGSNFAARLGRSIHSPTSLERWAKCPFSYFLGNVLRIGLWRNPKMSTRSRLSKRGPWCMRFWRDSSVMWMSKARYLNPVSSGVLNIGTFCDG